MVANIFAPYYFKNDVIYWINVSFFLWVRAIMDDKCILIFLENRKFLALSQNGVNKGKWCSKILPPKSENACGSIWSISGLGSHY
jgi:hypothetical protein